MIFQKALHLLFNFRKSALFRIGQRGQGKIPGIPGFVAEFPSGVNQGLCQLQTLEILYPVNLALGHIPPQVQQLPDTLCRLFPCDEGGIPLLDGSPGGNVDAIRIIPDGILPILNEQPRAVGAVALLQESGIVFQRRVLHEIGADNQAAVLVLETDTQGFVNDLLGKLRLVEEGLLFALLLGRKITAAQKGDLFLKTGRRYNSIYA